MASIVKRGERYQVKYRVGKKQTSKTFGTHREAREFKSEIERQVQQGTAADPSAARLTFEQWHTTWMSQRLDLRGGTRDLVQGIARKHLVPEFGDKRLSAITQQDVQTFVASRDVSPAYVARIYGELRACLDAAVDAGYLHRTPCRGIKLPKAEQHDMTVLDQAQIAELAACILPRYKALVYLLAYSGLRIGEAMALTPADVDTKARTVSVSKTVTRDENARKTMNRPKTRAGIRTVPIPAQVATMLAEHMETYPGDWVFTGGRGEQLRQNNFGGRTFKQAKEKMNKRRAERGEAPLNFRVHDLRHTAVTLWIDKRVDLPRIAAWAGHVNASFTLRQYAKYFPKDDAKYMDLIDADIVT